MMTQAVELYGQDIRLDANGQAIIAANGQLALTSEAGAAIQDIGLSLTWPLGCLFFDIEFGSELYKFVHDENTALNRAAMLSEVRRCVYYDPRVVWGSVSAEIISWDEREIVISLQGELTKESNPFNMVFSVGSDQSIIIKDINSNAGTG
jgi:phage baseplate assembly protein W